MSEAPRVPDLAERAQALETARSFIVQAPAGSGKTELLIQRFLALLGIAGRPEEIAAITFTIKAAAEMRRRVLEALHAARHEPRPGIEHEARTWDLARAALERNDALGWKLEETADRLRVQTIDALCASLTRQMPVLSRFGAQPESVEDASAMYIEAARNLLERLEYPDDPAADDVAHFLEHVDNNGLRAQNLIVAMLESRDHWIRPVLRGKTDRKALLAALAEVRAGAVARARRLWPEAIPALRGDDPDAWASHARAFVTTTGDWRKKGVPDAVRESEGLLEALVALGKLPPAQFEKDQAEALETIVRLAPRALSELQLVFAQRGQADFIEIAQGALRALEDEDGPTDLLLALDYRIRHLLVDEFQDTSQSQFELLEKLTSGWEAGDGRTLFLVGDPMQSIYRFREAEVELFLRAWREGIGDVKLATLTLSANFRSQAAIVDWVNASFARIMPSEDDIASGAVAYAVSHPVHPPQPEGVRLHPFAGGDRAAEAKRVTQIVAEAGPGTVAILVRNRPHLLEIVPRLRAAGLPFRAIEIETLGNRPVVQDLLAITRALVHLDDRIAWLAILRAPWCGLDLADLNALAALQDNATVWSATSDLARLAQISNIGTARLAQVRRIFQKALEQRRRGSLRLAVERVWMELGGPACVDSDTDLEDAEIYLDHLEEAEDGAALGDLADFEASVDKLFALPDLEAPERLQVMTIHKAKGLEFDTVIVPGLDSGGGRDDYKIFMWMRTPEARLLLAPINATGDDKDPVYDFIRRIDRQKADHENARLLYVAATRAKAALHLLGCVRQDHAGVPTSPTKGSLLAKLWPAVAAQFCPSAQEPGEPNPAFAVPRDAQSELRRLEIQKSIQVPPPFEWMAPPDRRATDDLEFSWVGDTARRVGSVVHRWLQRIAEDGAAGWAQARIEGEAGAVRKQLVAYGVPESELERATARVLAALGSALEDPRGRWLLGPQSKARNEYRISTTIDGLRHRLVLDRMFEDIEGRTWIVDYKTSSHEGGELDAFLAEEEARYRPQLDRYARAVAAPDSRRALYFPLLKGWREWT
jgi:ATP-dependent exoDNAse (exonuclease V) beta subunit